MRIQLANLVRRREPLDTIFRFVVHIRLRQDHASSLALRRFIGRRFIGRIRSQHRRHGLPEPLGSVRDLIRDHLIQRKVGQSDTNVIGVVTLVYDHRIHHLGDLLADLQHKASLAVNASLHIHLDEHNCLEVIVIRGRADKVHEVASKLIATKGVQNGKLVTTTPEMKH